ncbi:3-deoxy-7-phosphoheptulonate synthase [Solwaraspora sp. WMMB335]|uniref:3-deoxy-7-phosphoheptulonate synthase n=1 Tax=Solwaraspora sp. WMMB335 TaxID=3404118 RepID=UPI003B93D0E5
MTGQQAVLAAAAQQPTWSDPVALAAVTAELAIRPPLVMADECQALTARLAMVAHGWGMVIQGGDCAETFDAVRYDNVAGTVGALRQLAGQVAAASGREPVVIGRMAGQFAKPRSRPVEQIGGRELPVYRGDAVNDRTFTAAARVHDPSRMLVAYQASANVLAYARRAAGGGFFVSHEGLLLDYELPLTRPAGDGHFAASGHMLWIGERTRDPRSAHVIYAAGIRNPIGLKVGPSTTPEQLMEVVRVLDPERIPGRLTLISRMGADRVDAVLPALVAAVRAGGHPVVWLCDPMHGNTVTAPSGHKTRHVDRIVAEIKAFFMVHRAIGTHPGGVHLELTGRMVTECVDDRNVMPVDVPRCFESACDPRLNPAQVHRVGELLATLL